MFGLYDDLTGWITHRLVFLYLFSAVMGLLVSGTPASQAQSSTSFVPPELTAPYTLTFSVQIIKPSYVLENSLYQEKGFDGRQKGILTISSNGTRFLYMAKFGNWSDVIICDKAANDQYKYDTAFANAVVQPGVDDALAGMCLLPMPGTGYDFYPMFQTFTPSATGSSHGAMAVIGAVSSAVDGVAQAMLYQDALVTTRLSGFGETILSCKVVVPQNPALPEDLWTFSDYRMIGSVPVAGSIDHVNYISVGGQWPPSAMQPDGEVRYSLVSSSTKACTDQQFDLRSYLPTGLVVADARDFHPDPSLSNTPRYRWAKTPVSYYFKPDGGTLDEQAEAAVDAGVRSRQLQSNGRSGDQSKSGIYAIASVFFLSAALISWRRARVAR